MDLGFNIPTPVSILFSPYVPILGRYFRGEFESELCIPWIRNDYADDIFNDTG